MRELILKYIRENASKMTDAEIAVELKRLLGVVFSTSKISTLRHKGTGLIKGHGRGKRGIKRIENRNLEKEKKKRGRPKKKKGSGDVVG